MVVVLDEGGDLGLEGLVGVLRLGEQDPQLQSAPVPVHGIGVGLQRPADQQHICDQHFTSKKEVCSSHSLFWRFCQRRLTAKPKLATAITITLRIIHPFFCGTQPQTPREQ